MFGISAMEVVVPSPPEEIPTRQISRLSVVAKISLGSLRGPLFGGTSPSRLGGTVPARGSVDASEDTTPRGKYRARSWKRSVRLSKTTSGLKRATITGHDGAGTGSFGEGRTRGLDDLDLTGNRSTRRTHGIFGM